MRSLLASLLLLFAAPASGQVNLTPVNELSRPAPITAVAFAGSAQVLVFGTEDGQVFLHDFPSDQELKRWGDSRQAVRHILSDTAGACFAMCSGDRGLAILAVDSTKPVALTEPKGTISCLALSPDNRLLAAAGTKGEIYLWDFPSGVYRGELKKHKKDVLGIAFSRDGNQLLSADRDRLVVVWDIPRRQAIRSSEIEATTMPNSGIEVTGFACSADRRFLAAGIVERALEKGGQSMIFKYNLAFLDYQTLSLLKILEQNPDRIELIELPAGNCYAVTDNSTLRENRLAFWNIESGSIDLSHLVNGDITAVRASPDGQYLAAAYRPDDAPSTGTLALWDVSSSLSPLSCFMNSITVTTRTEPLIADGPQRTIAVLHFDCVGLDQELGKSFATYLEGRLVGAPSVRLVERNKIDALLRERDLNRKGVTQGELAQLGKMLGADAIVIGSLDKTGEDLVATVKLVSVTTSEIEGIRAAHCESGNAGDLFNLAAALAPTLAAPAR